MLCVLLAFKKCGVIYIFIRGGADLHHTELCQLSAQPGRGLQKEISQVGAFCVCVCVFVRLFVYVSGGEKDRQRNKIVVIVCCLSICLTLKALW